MRQRTIGVVLIAVGAVGLIGTAWDAAARSGDAARGLPADFGRVAGRAVCDAPQLPGRQVDVVLSDRGAMMGGGMMNGGRMMRVSVSPSAVAAGDVSFRVWNAGMMVHELVVLPLPGGQGPGTRPIGTDGRVSEAGSLGEASKSCGEGSGDGIAPGAASWVTLRLDPGRYELICNLPGHYASGMFVELDVR